MTGGSIEVSLSQHQDVEGNNEQQQQPPPGDISVISFASIKSDQQQQLSPPAAVRKTVSIDLSSVGNKPGSWRSTGSGRGGGEVQVNGNSTVSFSSTNQSTVPAAPPHHLRSASTGAAIDPNVKPTSWRNAQSFHSVASSCDPNGTSVTYGAQSKLPRLPIPTLEETLEKFPRVAEALLTESELEETKRECQKFLQEDGPALQEELLRYEKEGVEAGLLGSYVEEFWNESYLAVPSSVVLNLNPFFVLESGPDPKTAKDQLARAASLCFASVKLASLLKHETLRPDIFKGVPLCMDQFKVLFGSCRQPGLNHNNNNDDDDDDNGCGNSVSSHHTAGSSAGEMGNTMDDVHVYENSTHVAVLCKNQFYFFPALWPDSGHVAVDQTDIHAILKAIMDHAEKHDGKDDAHSSKTALGVLTSLPRKEWAVARQELVQGSTVNKQSLHVIDSALFVLVLDDCCPADIHETSANMLHGTKHLVETKRNNDDDDGVDFVQCGTCLNRWYDKLQLIVCKDGTAGVNFEHAAIDGHTALRFVSDIFAETVISFAESITQQVHGAGSIPHVIDAVVERAVNVLDDETGNPIMDCQPKKLVFELSNSLLKRIYFAETAICDQMVGNETHVLEFGGYGKLLIVGNKFSPDAVVQMSILLAYYKLYGRVVCQYEPVLTKSFYHGRTEAMRSATPAAKELCEIWCNKESTGTQKLAALRKATQEHSRLVRQCAGGKGVDRHLFALKCIADRMHYRPTPAFYKSVAWKKLNHTVLSTSNCGNPSLKIFGFGPVAQDGFGVGYIIKDNGISYSVASKHRQTTRFVHSIESVLREMQALMKPLSAVLVRQRSVIYGSGRYGSPSPPPSPSTTRRTQQHPASIPSAKQPSFSAYEDAYGETDFPAMKPNSSKTLPASQKQGSSRYFSKVKEQMESVDLVGVGFGVHGQGDDDTDFGAL